MMKKDLYPLMKLAIPLIMSGLVQSGSFFFETLFLAHLHTDVLAAGALVSWLFGTFVVVVCGTLSSINTLVAHKYGEKNNKAIAGIVRDGFWLAFILSLLSILFFWNISSLFIFLGQKHSIVVLAEAYIHALVLGLFPNFMMIALLEVIIGIGQAKVILKFSLLTVFFTVFFSYCLIFGKFGFPALGIAGAGFGVSISNWLSFLILSAYLIKNTYYHVYFKFIFSRPQRKNFMELIRIGLPMGLMFCIEVGFFFTVTLIMGSLSALVLAANQVVMQYLTTLMSVVFSIAKAITIRMGHLLGARELEAAKNTAYSGVLLSASFMFLVGLIYWFFPEILIALDFDVTEATNHELIQYTKKFLFIAAFFQIFDGIRISLFGALRSLRDTHFTLVVSIVSFWLLGLPIGYFLFNYFDDSSYWWGMTSGVLVGALLLLQRFKVKIKDYC